MKILNCIAHFLPWRNPYRFIFIFRGTHGNGNGNKIRRQLVAHGDYSNMANCWTIISRDMRYTFVIYCGVSKHLYTYSNISPGTPMMFCGTSRFRKFLCGKHLFKVKHFFKVFPRVWEHRWMGDPISQHMYRLGEKIDVRDMWMRFPAGVRDFCVLKCVLNCSWSHQLPILCVKSFSLFARRLGREVVYTFASSMEVKNSWNCTATAICLQVVELN
jgi:hypothetical protein